MFSLPLNFDCLSNIVDCLDVPDVVNGCIAIANRNDIQQLIKDRLSPVSLFSQLVVDPHELIYFMSIHRCVLSGSRAANYFYRGSSSNASDWDFCVETDVERDSSVFGGMLSAFRLMGVEWKSERNGVLELYGDTGLQVVKGTMTKGRAKGQEVQLISSSGSELLGKILGFHSTPVQCMITHYGAIHLYGKISRNREQIVWPENMENARLQVQLLNRSGCTKHAAFESLTSIILDDDLLGTIGESLHRLAEQYSTRIGKSLPLDSEDRRAFASAIEDQLIDVEMSDIMRQITTHNLSHFVNSVASECICIEHTSEKGVKKYVSRGYKIIDFTEYSTNTSGWHIPDRDGVWRTRRCRDSGTILVPFRGMGLWSPDRYIDHCLQHIAQFQWREYKGKPTMWHNGKIINDLIESQFLTLEIEDDE